MRTIIAGSRNIWSYMAVDTVIRLSGWEISWVVCGMAPGVDSVGWAWAHVNGIPIVEYPADWNRFGKSAGYRRNEEMARNADALIAVWDGSSKGTKHMVKIAADCGLLVGVWVLKDGALRYLEKMSS